MAPSSTAAVPSDRTIGGGVSLAGRSLNFDIVPATVATTVVRTVVVTTVRDTDDIMF
jgi:hypothetical protein